MTPCDTLKQLILYSDVELSEIRPWVFELRLPIPWEDGRVNCFLFPDGDRVDLVDCGMKSEASYTLIREAIREVAGPAARIGRLVVTHIHPDHYGGAGELTERDGAALFLHRLEVPMVHPRYLEIEHLVEEVGHHLRLHGVPEREADIIKNTSRGLREFVRTATPALQLDGTESIRLGSRRLRVEWTPGHSPGHVCLFDPDSRLLFAGDQLLPDVSPNIGLHPQSTPDPLHEYLDGLRRLAAYEPELILPAHGRPFEDAPARVRILESHHKRRLEQIVDIVGRGKETGWDVALELWGPRDHFYEKRLALQEALAHLQALAVDGRVTKSVTPETVRWTPV